MSGNGSVQSRIPPFSISFSGSGFLAVYQLGAAQCLFDLAPGVIHAAPKVFGASAGSLAAAAVVCGANMECMRDEMLATARASRKHLLGPLHPSFNVFKLLECCLHRSLPDNAHELATGRLYISMTRLVDGENILMSDFMSKEELVQALLCSCFVPFYCGLKPPSFRGEHYIDGGFTNIQPIQDSRLTLTVSPFAGEVDICPCDQPPSFYHVHVNSFNFQLTLQNFFRMMDALFPPTSVALKRAYYHGYQDAVLFLQANGKQHRWEPFQLKMTEPGNMAHDSDCHMHSHLFIFGTLAEALGWIPSNNYELPFLVHLLNNFLTIDFPHTPPARASTTLLSVFRKLGVPLAMDKTTGPSHLLDLASPVPSLYHHVSPSANCKSELRLWQLLLANLNGISFVLIHSAIHAVVHIINKGRSSSQSIMKFLCRLKWISLTHQFIRVAAHIPGHLNEIADSLSRFQFRNLAPDARLNPCTVPPYSELTFL
ncbi:PLPL2 protein, partial [Atractosteus spatula]|nr:PLPL2 protein [Atractosteus spatula]